MCDYSLHDVASRPAKVGDKLVSTQFPNAITRGFCDPSQPRVAVCLLPGTELAFEKEVECDASFRFLPTRKSPHKVARFRQVNLNRPHMHHDALEFPDGKIVLVTVLCEGHHATLRQLPSTGRPAPDPGEQEMPVIASLIVLSNRQRDAPSSWYCIKRKRRLRNGAALLLFKFDGCRARAMMRLAMHRQCPLYPQKQTCAMH